MTLNALRAERTGGRRHECAGLSGADGAGAGLIGLFAFLWALRSGQYSDVDGAALRVLLDDDVDGQPS